MKTRASGPILEMFLLRIFLKHFGCRPPRFETHEELWEIHFPIGFYINGRFGTIGAPLPALVIKNNATLSTSFIYSLRQKRAFSAFFLFPLSHYYPDWLPFLFSVPETSNDIRYISRLQQPTDPNAEKKKKSAYADLIIWIFGHV